MTTLDDSIGKNGELFAGLKPENKGQDSDVEHQFIANGRFHPERPIASNVFDDGLGADFRK